MQANGITLEQAAALTPLHVREYALASGWSRIQSKRPDRTIFSRPGSYDQLIFPNDPQYQDYAQSMFDVLQKLASVENRPLPEVYVDVLSPDADNVRAGIASPMADRGQIDFDFATRLLSGFRDALLSAAHSVITPLNRHPKLNRSDALEMIKGAKLNHSERSSYTVSVSLPLRAMEDSLPGVPPFTRQATELFMRSVYRLYAAIENDQSASAIQEQEGQPVISSNLCGALLKMQPPDERAELKLGVHWAPVLPAPEMHGIPRTLRLRRDHFEKINDLYARMLPQAELRPQRYVATVEGLSGYLDPDGRRAGDVNLNIFHEDEIILTRTSLDPAQHAIADKAYMTGDLVWVAGNLQRRPRVSLLSEVTYFKLLEDEPENGGKKDE